MRHPRYELRSVTGYPASIRVSGSGKLGTVYWIADTWNCYREVTLLVVEHGSGTKRQFKESGKTTTRLSTAERNLERLNREHDEWLASA